ncbi:hypothetical protein ACF8R4_08290 [Pseudomonas sp. FYR_2]|uniref:hypothetical protein n=1 Tax=unclassified Pseudomonas TaxID=196821 RepID=UPI00370C3DCE
MNKMYQISQSLADSIYSWSNFILVVGALLALTGTIGTVWSGGIRERYSDERIAVNEAETARAKEETQKAILEQQRLKSDMAWRTITYSQLTALAKALDGRKFDVWLSSVGDDAESTSYRGHIEQALKALNFKISYFSGYARATGLGILGGSKEDREFLAQAFEQANIKVYAVEENSNFQNSLEILVGSKPPPEFQLRSLE